MPPRPSCRRKAMDFLARRSHFRAELSAKLARHYEADEIAETLDRLAEEGLLDDRRTAGEFVRSRLGRRPTGQHKLRRELMARGVEAELAEEAISELLDDELELELARQAAERWRARKTVPPEDDFEARQALRSGLARHLEGRGFAGRAIVEALRALSADT